VPIYQYECPRCHSQAEELQAMGDAPPRCANCRKKMKRHYSGSVGLQFKGGGFHKTDYPSYGGTKGNPVMTVRNKSDDSKDKRAKPRSIQGVEDRLR
jgi:putative FmdB family regulatory protein